MNALYPFTAKTLPAIAEVGGKGWSLIRMTRHGLTIPPGFVLTVSFFEPWMASLKQSPLWTTFLAANPDEIPAVCDALKKTADALRLSPEQELILQDALGTLPDGPSGLFAVRSSSPEEDLAGSSFAGGYETVLGVTADRLSQAIRRAFGSALDQRVVAYKKQQGFDITDPQIAVIVQRQVASEIAGVGFSVNPITNAWDEAVFNANWGLGETVVSGSASPDLYLVDKPRRVVLKREVGEKETSLWLLPDGGTEQRDDPRHTELCLSDEQVLALTEQLGTIEALYQTPMDIEWAFADNHLYLLQARPITSWVALPNQMITEPLSRPRLFLDVTTSVQGVIEPLSPMGESIIARLLSAAATEAVGRDLTKDPNRAIMQTGAGRLWGNLSLLMALAGQQKLVSVLELMDPLAADALNGVDKALYRAEKPRRADLVPGLLRRMPARLMVVVTGRLFPGHSRTQADAAVGAWWSSIEALLSQPLSLDQLIDQTTAVTARLILRELLPRLVLTRRALRQIHQIFEGRDDLAEQLGCLDQSLPGNITVQMGMELADLAPLLGDWPFKEAEALEHAIKEGQVPQPFADGWARFLQLYGHRGASELDIAEARYREAPGLLLSQLLQLRDQPAERHPRLRHEACQRAREEAFEVLAKAINGRVQRARFTSLYRVVEKIGGLRETHKFCVIRLLDQIRSRILTEGERLVEAGRLDAGRIFDLRIDNLTTATEGSKDDLNALADANREMPDRIGALPGPLRLIDSRGLILRAPPPPPHGNVLIGRAISPGIARGRVNLLRRADEKPLLPGDILVARATDPGWTPLFVNAAAIVLEVGGLMQHGALVAREYGKPCVAGIPNLLESLRDGEEIEVDGATGVIRRLELPEEPDHPPIKIGNQAAVN